MSYRSDLMVARDLWNNRDSLNLPKEVYLRQIIQAMLRHAELDTSEGCPVCGGTDYNTYVGGFSSTEADIDVECGRCYFSWLVHMTPANR